MAAKKVEEVVTIKPVQMATVQLKIIGDSPLIMHAWSAKARREILQKELKSTKTAAREARNPISEFCSSMYWLTPMPEEFTEEAVAEALKTAKFGFPVTAIKQAGLSAAYRLGWVKDRMGLRGAFFIEPDHEYYYGGDLDVDYAKKTVTIVPNAKHNEQLIEIISDAPIMREDVCRVGLGSADLRYRGEFTNWSANLTLKYNVNGAFSLDQIVNILNAGGTVCGIGEWRVEKDGNYGMYHIS